MGEDGSLAERLRRANRHDGAVKAARALRRLAPGGSDTEPPPRSDRTSDRVCRLIAQVGAEQPSAARELGLAAVQVWQAVARRRAVGRDGAELTIVFTDLVGFSDWALHAGDDQVLRLLREVARACTSAITRHGGTVVKSLGDGQMAVFPETAGAIEACHQMCASVSAINLDGYRPQLRTGMHLGSPRRVGRDYLGVDVNIAARVSAAAAGGEVLVSAPALATVNADDYAVRRRRFRAKGAPADLEVFAVVPLYSEGR